MNSFGGGGSMGSMGSIAGGLGRAAMSFNESNMRSPTGGGGGGVIKPQSMSSGDGQDLDSLFKQLDKYFANRAGGIDPNKVKAQGTQVNYEF